jgi:hypothetical protein
VDGPISTRLCNLPSSVRVKEKLPRLMTLDDIAGPNQDPCHDALTVDESAFGGANVFQESVIG